MSSPRTILHLDMDAFFVSVELRRRPDLVGQPVVVGGAGPRGVVAAASYEARRYGVRSALPSSTAKRLCPQAVFLPGDHSLYAAVSADVHAILQTVTPFIEPLSLDEAFLDVTGALRQQGSGERIAFALRQRIFDELQLWSSVGVAPNKFLAKLGSVAAKPKATRDGVQPGRGVNVVHPGDELTFLHPLPVQALWGVGPATLQKLHALGVRTVGELAHLGQQALVSALGEGVGRHLYELSWARDERPVEVDRAAKSIGHEETFASDRHTIAELRRELVRLADGVASRLRSQGTGARTLTLKVRFAGFDTITRSVTLSSAIDTAAEIVQHVEPLLQSIDPGPGVRLLGVSTSNFGAVAQQLSLMDDASLMAGVRSAQSPGSDHAAPVAVTASAAEWRLAETTVDDIRKRFGAAAIGPGSGLSTAGLRVVRRGAQQWGPDRPDGPPASEKER
jgi:DNA polymerase IV